MSEFVPFHRVHIVGAAGAGMSALAKILAGRGHAVSGSDLRPGKALSDLADVGVEVWAGQRPDAVTDVDLVVASSAVPDSDPELRAARRSGITVWRRPELLESVTGAIPTIGATGTHGKTTTTGMLIAGCVGAGLDPSFVIGGELVEYRTNAVNGSDDLLVLEVDEAFGTFEHVRLEGLVVTNVEADHLDHFGSLDALEDAFHRVSTAVMGPVVVCTDDEGGARLADRLDSAVTYGTRSRPGRHRHVEHDSDGTTTLFVGDRAVRIDLERAGRHTALNAAGAVALLAELGHDPGLAAAGVSRYRGVARRFERRGTVRGVTVIDDYAHHPTEIAATLAEARAARPARVVAVFQPHLYSRTEQLRDRFGEVLAAADVVVVTDVYGSREAPRPGVTGALVADAARRAGAVDVRYVPHLSELAGAVSGLASEGDLVLLLGAGDITVVATELLIALDSGGHGG